MTAKPLVAGALPTKPADHRYWGNLHGAAGALAIFESACQHDGLTLVIAIDNAEAQRLEQALRFFLGQQTLGGRTPELLSLPDWETLPYDLFSPHPDIVSERIRTLHRLTQSRHGILVMPARTLLQRLAPQSYLSGNTLMLKVGQTLDGEKWRARLDAAGYRHSETVYEHGEYAVRGAILDVFPMGADTPYRIELFDNEVETLRTFDPETQRTLDKIERVELLPANEFPWHKDARQQFRLRWHEQFPGAAKECPLYQDVLSGLKPAGIEYYLPLFFDTCATLFDYVPAQTLIFTPVELESVLNQVQQDVQARYEDRRHDRLRPILPPGSLFMRTDECFSQLKAYPRITLFKDAQPEQTRAWNAGAAALPAVAIDGRAAEPLALLGQTLAQPGIRTLLCAETAGRREALQERLRAEGISVAEVSDWHAFLHGSDASAITLAAIEEGLWLPELGVRVIAEAELFGQRVMQRRRRERATEPSDMAFRSLAELRIGSPVVHIDHGVGRYQGLQTLDVDGQATEFLTLSYADGARLYVPVSNLHLISRYSGADDELAPLHKLGSDRWSQTRQKALERIRDTAAELLDVYARREAREGHRFPPPDDAYHAFCAGFPFEETTDQLAAIDAVIRDLTSPRPMDRLVCGDVGFGKTEVAMRAAFLVVNGGRQVAVLVPTTLLAQQHFESFRDRFAETAVKIELLSRFRTGKQQEQALASIAEGKADIIIGTHKLLSGDIRFHNLGLVIIDEEHRFGVSQKERLKQLRAEVDLLALTATPIPRTLNMAMGQLRDLSIIATPPARRLSVRTFVRQREEALIKEAILREILRGGQVYFLHNDVSSIERAADTITQLVPEARVGIAHGQMRERELEQVMSDFYHKRFNVLVCSTIIETGIDVPNANTILIERADKFGLAQLHQLRGRVGRSHHQAYAYLLTPPPKQMTTDAQKRLDAISAAQDLGAGFTLATQDLEIRGAGELLGEEQSGQIESIGFTLYMELLEEAVKAIREGRTPNAELPLHHGTEINLRIPALIPEDYLPDVHNRLLLYKRIAAARDAAALDELQVEMIDRFGLLPDPAKYLLRQAALRIRAQALGIVKIDGGEWGRMEFSSAPHVDPFTLVQLVQRQSQDYRLEQGNTLRFRLKATDADGKLNELARLLDVLERPAVAHPAPASGTRRPAK